MSDQNRSKAEKTLAVRVPRELHDAFAKAAAREDRTVSGELRRLMRLRVQELLPSGEKQPQPQGSGYPWPAGGGKQ